MSWKDKQEVRKGRIGEALVIEWLEGKGFVVYQPLTDGAHPFDNLCASRDKKTIFVAEVKSKAHRTYYPDTGIETRHYDDYKNIQNTYGIRTFIFFVDEHAGRIYGNWLDKLDEPCQVEDSGRTLNYPLVQKSIRYFPLCKMVQVCSLNGNIVQDLKALSNRHHEYPQEAA